MMFRFSAQLQTRTATESFDWIDAIIDNPMVIDNGFARPREGEGWGFRFLHEFMTEVKG